ncbi:MAG: ribbon-helix-helix protein, CopG family [Clostridia bacterium]|nr:ribbon-helix-helix protein, CopG family [Clostridia bacterium]
MKPEIRISKKSAIKGEDGHKVVSVRMKDETIARLDKLSVQTNRSRNEIINMLLESALDIVTVVPEGE